MFEIKNKIIKVPDLRDFDPEVIEFINESEIDYHQTILNIGYGWWNSHPNPNKYGFPDMIEYMDKTYGAIFGTLILIGKLNQQVNNGGFIQYYNNGYSRERKDDFEQSLHIKIVKDLTDILSIIDTLPNTKVNEYYVLKKVLKIFQEYLEVPIDLEEYIEEEVEYGCEENLENGGDHYFQVEEINNDLYGEISDPKALDDLDERYYKLDEIFMETMNLISKICFETVLEEPLIENVKIPDLSIDQIDPIDPEMNIEKVVEMITDATSLSYTKGESQFIMDKFIENFNKEYLIIKKVL
jgi:hypothetical protein